MLRKASACKSTGKHAYLATLEEIRETDYNSHILCDVDPFEEKAEIDIPTAQGENNDIEAQHSTVRAEMRCHLKKLGLAPK